MKFGYINQPYNIVENGELTIGKDVLIRPFVSINCQYKITIDEGSQIASGVSITDHDHDMGDPENIGRIGKCLEVRIGKKCWIGSNAVILKGVTLGDYCIVGAGAVVTKSFPERSIIVGNPAKLLRKR